MIKPSNYDSTTAKTSFFSNPTAGAYVFGIVKAEETTSREGNKPMLVLYLDIAEGEHKNNYTKMSSRVGSDCLIRKYMLLTDGNAEYLKGDIQSIEKSNVFTFNWDSSSLVGKKVGGMLGEEEYYSKKEVKTQLSLKYLCTVEKAISGELKIPKKKKLDMSFPGAGNTQRNTIEAPPANYDDGLPF